MASKGKAEVAEVPAPLVRIAEVLAELHGGDPAEWVAEAERVAEGMRGRVTRDWRGHPCLNWIDAERWYLAQLRDRNQALAEIEERAVEADAAFRASLPRGIPAGMVPEGMTAGLLMMSADPMGQGSRRRTPLEDALAGDGMVFRPIRDEQAGR